MLDDFLFGAASSAYQIEGAWNEDGKGPSIWDEISHGKSRFKVKNKHTGDIACDHYHQWANDIEIMKFLGLKAYRFSISWSRIFPTEKDKPNKKGIQFYANLCKALLDAGIEPFVTLYHWDLPLWLDKVGGWGKRQSVDHFYKYADTMFNALTEEAELPVKYWITFNEPAVFVHNFWGHNDFPKAVKNVLRAHGETVELFNERYKKHPNIKAYDGQIGIAPNLHSFSPNVYGDKQDEKAVENAWRQQNGLWLDPIFYGKFPENINNLLGLYKRPLKLTKEERETISTPIDFLGVNYYSAPTVKYNKYKPPGFYEGVSGNFDRDEMGIEIKPQGIHDITVALKERYENPTMYITENGCACTDVFGHDGHVHDYERIDYIKQHLVYCNFAITDGADIKGYFYWSLMDNFEWLLGYNKRFGLLYIFYPTKNRVQKDSFYWYKKIIESDKYRKKQLSLSSDL